MKWLLSSILFMLSVCCIAQQQDSTIITAKDKRFYIGAQGSTVSYMLIKGQPRVSGGVQPIAFLNVGYKLNKRTTLQLGLGYGNDEWDSGSIYYKSADSVIYDTDYQRTRGVAVPLTAQYTPFNPAKKLQLYAIASIVPVFGSIKKYVASEMDGIKTVHYDTETSVINVFATAGLMLNYRISKRFDGYIEGNLFYKNLGKNSNYADSKPKSIGIGVNYKL